MPPRDQRASNLRYYWKNRAQEIERVRRRQGARLIWLRELRSRPCSDCLGRFEPFQMDFDHRDASEKGFRLTSGRAMLASESAVVAEVAKCDVICANCHRIRTQMRHAAGIKRRDDRAASPALLRKRQSWREHAQVLDRLRDVPCADCGRRFPPCAMDFDHRNPRDKRHGVTRMIGRAGLTSIMAEVAKCDIVCANCHRARTARRRDGSYPPRE